MATLKNKSVPWFLETSSFEGHENVSLISLDGYQVKINACVFASVNPWCYEILKNAPSEQDDIYLITEWPITDLVKFKSLATTGCVDGWKTNDGFQAYPDLTFGHGSFGLVNQSDNFSEVKSVRITDIKVEPVAKYHEMVAWEIHLEQNIKKENVEEKSDVENSFQDGKVELVKLEEPLGDDIVVHNDLDAYQKDDHDWIEPTESNTKVKTKGGKVKKSKKIKESNRIKYKSEKSCALCTELVTFKTVEERREHLREVHNRCSNKRKQGTGLFHFPTDERLRDNTRQYQCDKCVRSFTQKCDLKQHILRHSAKSPEDKFFCVACPGYVAFATRKALRAHDDKLHWLKSGVCPYCPQTFPAMHENTMNYCIKRHILKAHEEVGSTMKRHVCISCGIGYQTKKDLNLHKQCKGEYHDAKCRVCDSFEAKTRPELLNHFEKVHNGVQQFKCGRCPEYFPAKGFLRQHKTKCVNYQQSMCPECGKMVGKLAKHLSLVHRGKKDDQEVRQTFPCTVSGCKIVCSSKSGLIGHMEIHEQIQCDICGATCTQATYKRHMIQKHTPDHLKPFVCKVEGCGKGFPSNCVYKDHMNTHTGAKPHKCKFCNACFANSGTKAGHVRSVHLGKKRK